MTAGFDCEAGTTPIASRVGARAADWAAEKRTSRVIMTCDCTWLCDGRDLEILHCVVPGSHQGVD